MDFFAATNAMEARLKFCSWGVRPNGDVGITESLLCGVVGNVESTNKELTEYIRGMSCMECMYAKNVINTMGIPYSLVFQ
jgi:hypothetical protein